MPFPRSIIPRVDIAPPRAAGARPVSHLKTLRVREQSRTGALKDVPKVMGGGSASCRSYPWA
jgi:hypothetical protein